MIRLTPFQQLRVDFEGSASVYAYCNNSYEVSSINFEDGTDMVIEPIDLESQDYPGYPSGNLVENYSSPEWFTRIVADTQVEVIDTFRLLREATDNDFMRQLSETSRETYKDKMRELGETFEDTEHDRKPTFNAWDLQDQDVIASLSDFNERFQEVIVDLRWYGEIVELWEEMTNIASSDEVHIAEYNAYVKPFEDFHQWFSVWKDRIKTLRRMIIEQPRKNSYSREISFLAAIDFFEIINERFLFKKMTYEEEGISFYTPNNRRVPIRSLSSGEQHLLLLYFHLLFGIEPDTLVMIDEPELSMNVVWQRNFLKDLQRIIELRKFDVLIATHSPMIIHDKWDWVVHLGEKVDD